MVMVQGLITLFLRKGRDHFAPDPATGYSNLARGEGVDRKRFAKIEG